MLLRWSEVLVHDGLLTAVSELSGMGCDRHLAVHRVLPHRSPL